VTEAWLARGKLLVEGGEKWARVIKLANIKGE
jgi:hypothetical protein